MSSWVPEFDQQQRGPLYWRIATALARDIESGRLNVGERLPTHRALAEALGVTANTVTKAYAEAERNGLVVSRTGRGTYVGRFPEELADGSTKPQDVTDLSINFSSSATFNPVFNRLLGALSRRGSLHGLLEHHPHPGLGRHRAAGARWIARRGIEADSNRVIICNGAQEGILAVLEAVTRPGDIVLTEKLNYAGVRRVADTLHVNLRGVDIDDYGLIPEKLEAACKNDRVAAILVTPTNHNPTNVFTPVERRRAVAQIAKRAGVLLIEDDIFGHMSGDDTPTLTALAPDNCVYICGLSKSIAAGLRVGYIFAPAALLGRIVLGLRMISWTSPALMSEIMTLLVEEGHVDEFATWHRHEAQARYQIACHTLELQSRIALPSYHMWVPLEEPLRSESFVAELKSQGVLVSPSSQFAIGDSQAPEAIRLGLGAERDQTRLQQALDIIALNLRRELRQLHDAR